MYAPEAHCYVARVSFHNLDRALINNSEFAISREHREPKEKASLSAMVGETGNHCYPMEARGSSLIVATPLQSQEPTPAATGPKRPPLVSQY